MYFSMNNKWALLVLISGQSSLVMILNISPSAPNTASIDLGAPLRKNNIFYSGNPDSLMNRYK